MVGSECSWCVVRGGGASQNTSEWTLDYPPLFAYFEWLLGCGAPLFDGKMLELSVGPYDSPMTAIYMRLSVVASEVVWAVALALYCGSMGRCVAQSMAAVSLS